MEIFELRYFLEVAKLENIHRASERLRVAPSSLSKAVARLETELGVALFERAGRSIHLSNAGKLLKVRAADLLDLELRAREEIAGRQGVVHVAVTGSELLLGYAGQRIVEIVRKKNPTAQFEFTTADDATSVQRVERNESQLAIITGDAPATLAAKLLGETKFYTVVGVGHPLYKNANDGTAVRVEKVLEHGFVSASHPIFGKVGKRQSLDGWRDDQFPRKIDFLTSSLGLMVQLVEQGKAIAYLPDYLTKRLRVKILKVTGCPYTCVQRIHLLAKHPEATSWLKQLF